MIKFIIFILVVLMIIGSGDVFTFASSDDIWTITINHQELLTSIYNGAMIVYDFVMELISANSTATNTQS